MKLFPNQINTRDGDAMPTASEIEELVMENVLEIIVNLMATESLNGEAGDSLTYHTWLATKEHTLVWLTIMLYWSEPNKIAVECLVTDYEEGILKAA